MVIVFGKSTKRNGREEASNAGLMKRIKAQKTVTKSGRYDRRDSRSEQRRFGGRQAGVDETMMQVGRKIGEGGVSEFECRCHGGMCMCDDGNETMGR